MLHIECENCGKRFWVEGYTTPDSWMEPGETVTELESDEELCECINEGGDWILLDEEHQTFGDDF